MPNFRHGQSIGETFPGLLSAAVQAANERSSALHRRFIDILATRRIGLVVVQTCKTTASLEINDRPDALNVFASTAIGQSGDMVFIIEDLRYQENIRRTMNPNYDNLVAQMFVSAANDDPLLADILALKAGLPIPRTDSDPH